MAVYFVNWNKTNIYFRCGSTILHQNSPKQCKTLHLTPKILKTISQGFSVAGISSCPVGKYKCNVSGKYSIMYLSTFSYPFQFGIVNSGDE